MPFPPDAYLIGAQKAGTTTLAYLLDQHPSITVAQPKEPHYFTENRNKGLDWYKQRFPGPAQNVHLDASTSYSMASLGGVSLIKARRREDFEGVPNRVRSVSPNARFVYLLRDPVERTYSSYWHNVRMGLEKRDFIPAVRSDSFYLDVSDYRGQLLRWLDSFPLSSFLFVLFEDLKDDPEQTAKRCCDFLGAEPDALTVRLDSVKNQSFQVGWVGRQANRVLNGYPRARTAIKSAVPRGVVEKLAGAVAGSERIPPMDDEARQFLAGYFQDKNRELGELINKPLDRWEA